MTTLLKNDIRKRVTDPLDSIHQETGDTPFRVFSDWVNLTLASFTGDEESYQKTLSRYRSNGFDEDAVDRLVNLHAEALGGLVLGLEESKEDILGGVYEHYGLTSDRFGQYFTPGPVSRAMAAMTIPDDAELREGTLDDPLVIGDISGCGSGRLIVDTARQLRVVAPEVPAVFLGYEKDSLCAKMAVINFVLNDVIGYVLLGDALKLKPQKVWSAGTGRMLKGERPVSVLTVEETDWVVSRFFGEEDRIAAEETSQGSLVDFELG
ncbi:N-6 DNA methylase [Haloarcula onubensis]|uniref:N-6 DNA methylase n=1 Tax=Haloarcula onubensis TaxID=2950539 RepID=A0ABU2FSU5_9EURY|nr:N-6 DNA methylase [Halomicroarcula sp. S3CR25-11]MDS0283838.1 N-6 DNA methylase [Halomicroarcula sp. S3CR25-11]